MLYIAPSKDDLWKADKEHSFVVKVDAKMKPPPGINIIHEEDGITEKVFQPYEFPDLTSKCGKCGSVKHKTNVCPELSPWKAALIGKERDPGSCQEGETSVVCSMHRSEVELPSLSTKRAAYKCWKMGKIWSTGLGG